MTDMSYALKKDLICDECGTPDLKFDEDYGHLNRLTTYEITKHYTAVWKHYTAVCIACGSRYHIEFKRRILERK
jgi:hypothetical protein